MNSGLEGITLHYHYVVTINSPNVRNIAWTKNGTVLNMDNSKYLGGGIDDRRLTITSPTADDAGLYTCIVSNPVGAVSESLTLGNVLRLNSFSKV